MRLTRDAGRSDLLGYLEQHPIDRGYLKSLQAELEQHLHESEAACGDCPVILPSAILVSDSQRVLQFWCPLRNRWDVKQGVAASDPGSLLTSAYQSLKKVLGSRPAIWVHPHQRVPILIEVTRAASELEGGRRLRTSFTFHYLFRTEGEPLPESDGPFPSAVWQNVDQIRNAALRRRLRDVARFQPEA